MDPLITHIRCLLLLLYGHFTRPMTSLPIRWQVVPCDFQDKLLLKPTGTSNKIHWQPVIFGVAPQLYTSADFKAMSQKPAGNLAQNRCRGFSIKRFLNTLTYDYGFPFWQMTCKVPFATHIAKFSV
jgi:hypothetical protein